MLLIYYWYGLKWTTTSGAGTSTSTSAVAHISSFLGFNSSWWHFQSHYCPLLWLKVCGIKVMSTVSWCVVLWLLVMQYRSSPPGGALFSKYPHIEIYTICAICKNNVKMLTTKTLTYQSKWNTQRAVYRCPCTLRLATSVRRVLNQTVITDEKEQTAESQANAVSPGCGSFLRQHIVSFMSDLMPRKVTTMMSFTVSKLTFITHAEAHKDYTFFNSQWLIGNKWGN